MTLIKLNISNCIFGCCDNIKWKYNEEELLNIIYNNNIERIIIFCYYIDNYIDEILKIINIAKENNIKISIRTIFYKIDAYKILDLLKLYNKVELEIIYNVNTNYIQEQSNLRNIIIQDLIENKIRFDIINIFNIDLKEDLYNILSSNIYEINDIFKIYTDIEYNIIKEISYNNNYIVATEDDYKNDKIIKLNYKNCDNINNKKYMYILKKKDIRL